jgi:hypothetical protein
MSKKFVDFNDSSLPIGVRKKAYVSWVIKKGAAPIDAKRQANKKFGFEKKPGIFAICNDCGRCDQFSFTGKDEIFANHDLRKYEAFDYRINPNEDDVKNIRHFCKENGWNLIFVDLIG